MEWAVLGVQALFRSCYLVFQVVPLFTVTICCYCRHPTGIKALNLFSAKIPSDLRFPLLLLKVAMKPAKATQTKVVLENNFIKDFFSEEHSSWLLKQ